MGKVLLFASIGIGDHISSTLVIARHLSLNNDVDCIFSNLHGYRLLRHAPYITACILSNNTQIEYLDSGKINTQLTQEKIRDLSRIFSCYDKVYINRPVLRKFITRTIEPKLLSYLVEPNEYDKTIYRPHAVSKEFNFELFDPKIDINWYEKYYHNFNCGNNTLLLNCDSSFESRTYKKMTAIKDILSDTFDIRCLDLSQDIRKNIHLINQCQYILTTDTSTLWLAKALGKNPFVFLAEDRIKINQMEMILGVKNIVKTYKSINNIPPTEIAHGFLNELRKHFKDFV